MSSSRLFLLVLLSLLIAADALSQTQRPIPYPVIPSNAYQAALERGTRTPTGEPGPAYWQNYARYEIEASLDPQSDRLSGRQRIVYRNNSPYALNQVFVHLYQNLHEEGAIRNRPQQITGGMEVEEVIAAGEVLSEDRSDVGYAISGTIMMIRLPETLEPESEVELEIRWNFEVPRAGAPRMGQDGEVYYLGYWYPQLAVFDDVEGWVIDPYLGEGEFYMGFADYDVRLTVPNGWLVSATGDLVNAGDVLSQRTRERLAARPDDGSVVRIVDETERGDRSALRDGPDGRTTWHFRADNVRDFAFGTSRAYVWDSAIATLPGGEKVDIHALFRPEFEAWHEAAEYGRFSIEFMSERFMDYPWPHMSILEGIIGGGMEYPMITLIGSNRSPRSLFGTTLHEIVHMWFPMLVNQNEKRYTWMDEGLTSFLTAEGTAEYWGDDDVFSPERQSYYRIAGSDLEVAPMRHADRFPIGLPSRGIAHYSKPAVAFNSLRHILGDDVFWQALREYADRWTYRHPYPWDMFSTFSEVAGTDLDWFWRSTMFETWPHDLAVADVQASQAAVRVVVEDVGLMPMPVIVRVTYADGMTAQQEIPVDVWLEGERRVELAFQGGDVVRVEVDPDWHLPDVDRSNNVWEGSRAAIGG